MNDAQMQALLSAVRHVLGAIGGYFVGRGLMAEETVTQTIVIVVTLMPLVWGVWQKFSSEEKTKAREAVAVNVGIAVADRTVGLTPTVPAANAPAVIEAFAPVVERAAPDPKTTGLAVTPASPVLPVAPAVQPTKGELK